MAENRFHARDGATPDEMENGGQNGDLEEEEIGSQNQKIEFSFATAPSSTEIEITAKLRNANVPVAPRAHKKSRRGCKTCKLRKIKCDERHPLCDNCHIYYQGKQVRCDYGDVTISSPLVKGFTTPSRAANQTRKRKTQNIVIPIKSPSPLEHSSHPPPSRTSSSTLMTPISAQMLDPFTTHPPTPTPEPEADELLQHYFQSTVYTMFPFYPTATINPQAEFYSPLIYTDALLYHVSLQISALHLEKLMGSRRRVTSKTLMDECLGLLRRRIEGHENGGAGSSTSDETIAAVAGLVGIEHEKGNVRMVQLHMRGLKRMLDLRGGINALRKSNGMVANIVFCTFVATNEETFPAIDLLTTPPPPPWYTSTLPLFDISFYIPFKDLGVPTPYAAVLHDIRILAATYQQASDCSDSSHYLSVLVHLCLSLQKVMSFPPADFKRTKEYCLAESVRAALLLHVFHLWCGRFQPDPSLLVSNARQNLKSSLKPLLASEAANPLLLWFACVGSVSSPLGSAERKWFTGHVAPLVRDLGLGGYEDLRNTLRQVVWHELQDGPTHKILWSEMADLMQDLT